MRLLEYDIQDCWREGPSTKIRLLSRPDVSAWVRGAGPGVARLQGPHAGHRTARSPPAARRRLPGAAEPSARPPTSRARPPQIPESLVKSVGAELSYVDEASERRGRELHRGMRPGSRP